MNQKITLSGSYTRYTRKRKAAVRKVKVFGNHQDFLQRIEKTLYYGKLPKTERFSLPVSELAAEIFSKSRFPGNSVHLSLRPGGKMLGLERLSVGEAGEISRAACISPCSLVLALIYVDRLRDCNPKYLEKTSPSKLFLVSLMVASKFLHDDGEDDEVFNDEWAASSGMDPRELNCEERDFLAAIDWRVNVKELQFFEWLEAMEEAVAFREGHRRGFFTYTDLNKLLQFKELTLIAKAVLTVSAVCLTSYTAGILTIFGSNIIVSSLPSPVTSLLNILGSPAPSLPSLTPFQRDHGHLSDICSMESVVRASTHCNLPIINQSHSTVPNVELKQYGYLILSFLNATLVPTVVLPEKKTVNTLLGSFNIASRIFDTFFNRTKNIIYTSFLSKKSMQQGKVSDTGFCIQLSKKKWMNGENISQNFLLPSNFWHSGTSTVYNDKTISSSDFEMDCDKSPLSLSRDSPFSLGTSQY